MWKSGLAAAIGVMAAACATTPVGTDPAGQRAALAAIETELAAASATSWDAYQAALAEKTPDILDVAARCEKGTGLTDPQLIAACYWVSADAYALMLDRPFDEADAVDPVVKIANLSEALQPYCGNETAAAACDSVSATQKTALARRASSLLRSQTAPADADTVIGFYSALSQDIDANWSAFLAPTGDGAQDAATLANKTARACAIACNAIIPGPNLGDLIGEGGDVNAAAAAFETMAQSAGAALQPNLCAAEPRDIPGLGDTCAADPKSADCAPLYAAELKFNCGPGVALNPPAG